ncbi:Asp-tRNA(Asn)/Glu-tRNA(Gln) amidotransferase subunit GatB [Candidatus Saccharibacteria bacterium]|nr:Asp-tRNA(Asn)/Glu-tRNA(Gln) amidotransferase subunit GatB [Candidatus Saccharibacteria bacterium]
MSKYDEYEMTIGIECHVQLATKTKLFSPANNDSRGAEPNSCIHYIDWALPGMLPVLNREAVRLAVMAGGALNSEIANVSRFDRKHYFYPDLPKGYQISQMYQPIILGGFVEAPLDDGSLIKVRLHHAHLEEDAGKLTHSGDYSLVDLNRAGTPLIEIVSEPDIHSAQGARAYASELHRLMVFAGVTNGDLYHGNMRFDVNISVAKKGAQELGKRAEVKNLNSFRSVEKSAEFEFKRQVDLLERGEIVLQETRGWHDDRQETFSQRSKEDAQDYRYMPDPDIPPIVLDKEQVRAIQAETPMLPSEYRLKWASLGLDKSVINSLLANQVFAEVVTEIQQQSGDNLAKRVAHWFVSSVSASAQEESDGTSISNIVYPETEDLVELANMAESDEVNSTNAKELFSLLLGGATSPRQLAVAKKMIQVSDENAIKRVVDEVLADPDSQASISDFKAGKEKAIGYLVGQVMKKSQGQANPALAQKLLREKL